MNLHLDRNAFLTIISLISEQTNLRADVIEKDYYVTLMLWELSQKQKSLPAYFKGGTALYKALKNLRRFSEDIDLTVETKDCTNAQKKKRLEFAANKYKTLTRTNDKSLELNSKGSITSVYEYIPVTEVDSNDQLQRFRFVKIEATSFTISEPFEEMEIEPILYTLANVEQKEILKKQFQLTPFFINTITIERIFADKIIASEFYYQRGLLFDVSKHLYDLTVLMSIEKIQTLINNKDNFKTMINYKRLEEKNRIGSDLSAKPFKDFKLFLELEENHELQNHFKKMQEIYVFNTDDIIKYEGMQRTIQSLYKRLLDLEIE